MKKEIDSKKNSSYKNEHISCIWVAGEDEFVREVDQFVGNYQMAGLEYIFTPQRNMAFLSNYSN